MLYIGIALGISRIFYPETSQLRQLSDVAFSYVMMIGLFTVGIQWFMIHMIGRGKNWARIPFLVLFIVGIPFFIYWGSIPQIAVKGVALVFLFQKASSDWFKAMKSARPVTSPQC
jgi:hypothetical protein